MGIKAVAMMNRGSNLAVAEKLLERALELFPDSALAVSTLEAVEERRLGSDIEKAFKRQNPLRAAKLVLLSKNPDNRAYFFETMTLWYQDIQASDQTAQKTLFDPIARAAAEFEYCLDPCRRSTILSSEPAEGGERPTLKLLR